MKPKPIIFSAPMVRAILDGRKTQTRRVLKPQPRLGKRGDGTVISGDYFVWEINGQTIPMTHSCMYRVHENLPYTAGQLLWVREAWRAPEIDDIYSPSEIGRNAIEAGYAAPWSAIQFEADATRANWKTIYGRLGRYRHARFMPLWASRLTLRVTDVRVQRLHEISEADAEAEGIVLETADPPFYYVPGIFPHSITGVEIRDGAAASFARLWSHIHGPGAWERNDWVAALTFEVIHANIDDVLREQAA